MGSPEEFSLASSVSDYVCVLDVDLLELVIKTWKGSTEGKLVGRVVGSPNLTPCQPTPALVAGSINAGSQPCQQGAVQCSQGRA